MEDLALSNACQLEALTNVLERKGGLALHSNRDLWGTGAEYRKAKQSDQTLPIALTHIKMTYR